MDVTDRLTTALAALPVDYPDLPDLSAALDRLDTQAGDTRPRRHRADSLAAIAMAVAVTLAAVIGPVRSAVADWLGIGAIRIATVAAIPIGLDHALSDLGAAIPVADAGPWPADLGRPDGAFRASDLGAVSMVWLPGDGLPDTGSGFGALFTRFEGRLELPVIEKGVPGEATVTIVPVGAHRGYWISGAAHSFGYIGADGEVMIESLRLAGNTLLWEIDGTSYRLESALGPDAATAIAATLGNRPG